MNLFAELKCYLDSNFSGLKLIQPLFFKEAPGLRFDLQDATLETGEDPYFAEVVRRMDSIQSFTMSDSDIVMLLYQKYTYKRQKIRLTNYLFKQINKRTASVQFKRNMSPVTDVDGYFTRPADGSCQVVIKDFAGNINFHNLYLAISHGDFGCEPLLTACDGELYIINLSRNTVTLMYDDRGCDLVSYDIHLLKCYYKELSHLILEANRSQILERLCIAE
jgi:hypothetical protein